MTQNSTVERLARIAPSDRPDEIADKLNQNEALRNAGVTELEPPHNSQAHRDYLDALVAERAANAKAADTAPSIVGDGRPRTADDFYNQTAPAPEAVRRAPAPPSTPREARSGFAGARGEVNAA